MSFLLNASHVCDPVSRMASTRGSSSRLYNDVYCGWLIKKREKKRENNEIETTRSIGLNYTILLEK